MAPLLSAPPQPFRSVFPHAFLIAPAAAWMLPDLGKLDTAVAACGGGAGLGRRWLL